MYQLTVSDIASSKPVNWKPGRKRRSFSLDAVFFSCPSALLVSNLMRPLKWNAAAMDRATCSIVTSSASSTGIAVAMSDCD